MILGLIGVPIPNPSLTEGEFGTALEVGVDGNASV